MSPCATKADIGQEHIANKEASKGDEGGREVMRIEVLSLEVDITIETTTSLT